MSQLGRYQILRKLSEGGMAEVYLARSGGAAGFQKTVVVKRIRPELAHEAALVKMFIDEARLAAQLSHPNIVQIFDLGEEDGQFLIAMEYVDGPSLYELLSAAAALHLHLPVDLSVKAVVLVLEALAYAHAQVGEDGAPLGLIHRDVSPENVLLSRSGAVKLADFGIARAANQARTTGLGGLKGKLHYLAPEMVRGKPYDARADLFSLGVVLYQLLTQKQPFEGAAPGAVLEQIVLGTPRPLREHRAKLSLALQVVVDRALAKSPEDRYPNARAMQADLEKVLRSLGTSVGGAEIAELIGMLCPPPGAPPTPVQGLEPTLVPSRAPTQKVASVTGGAPRRAVAIGSDEDHDSPTQAGAGPEDDEDATLT